MNKFNLYTLNGFQPIAGLHSVSRRWLQILLLFMIGLSTAHALDDESIVHSLSEIQSGSLLVATANNGYLRTPLLDTSVQIGIQGMLARTEVQQTFTNNSNDWIEAIYVFPLPDNARVDSLTMIVADTQINGIIQPRSKARRTYNTAKREGKKASLLEQQRANLFTTKVANIPPGDNVVIRIIYQASVKYTDGQFEMAFPLTITPRYIPGTALTYDSSQIASASGWSMPTDLVPDADLITPPVTDTPSQVSIAVSIDAGLDGLTIASSTHDIITTPGASNLQTYRPRTYGSQTYEIALANNTTPADRDFKLTWTPAPTRTPIAAVFRQDTTPVTTADTTTTQNTHSFASIMLMPPQQIYATSQTPREVIFVIDTSGSMQGSSIVQARKALNMSIERLSSGDIFNVIEFDSDANKLFPNTVGASVQNKRIATNWISGLQADDGTEILGALKMALKSSADESRLRQIVFITDGSVGNEDQIFKYLQNNIGNSRLFTIGIGSAPNTWFMRKAAETGRGSYTSISNLNELSTKVITLLERLEKPALTDIQITFNTTTRPEVYPVTVPDVYFGQPVLADARWLNKLRTGSIEITGKYAGNPWSQKLQLNAVEHATEATVIKGLDKLWAHRKIESLENQRLFNSDTPETGQAITDIAMQYSMVTKYTSLVAVEQKVSRDPHNTPIHAAAVPQAIPAGHTMLFPQGSLGTRFKFVLSILFAMLSVVFGLASLRQTRQFENYQFRNAQSKCNALNVPSDKPTASSCVLINPGTG